MKLYQNIVQHLQLLCVYIHRRLFSYIKISLHNCLDLHGLRPFPEKDYGKGVNYEGG